MIKAKKAVRNMQPYNPPLEGRRDFIRLDFNENTVGPSKKVINAIKNVKQDELSSYPEYSKFKKRLAGYLRIRDSELVVTNASDEAMKLVIETYMEKEDEIIIPVPTFPMFKFYSQLAGVKIKEISYNKDYFNPMGPWKIVADDFRCLGSMPVGSIHWWGSHFDWEDTTQMPPASWWTTTESYPNSFRTKATPGAAVDAPGVK